MTIQAGFTLVEVIATGVISAFAGVAILTVLHMSNENILEGRAETKLTQLQAVASEQMRKEARLSFGVIGPGEDATAIVDDDLGLANMHEVRFCNADGSIRAGYDVTTDTLKEWTPGGWKPFKVGADTVFVKSGESFFDYLPKRHGVSIRITYAQRSNGKTFTFPPIADLVRCRNTSL